MKIEEFKKYKRLVESQDLSLLTAEIDVARIYQWMENSGRIDEGFWGSIWSWLKRNFSPTSSKLHKLADEFGEELSKELKAEFDRKEDSKDKAAQMRSSWAGKISGDIEERMRIVAEDDPEYQDLVRYLINKKTLEAKRANLKYLDADDQKSVDKDLKKKEEDNEKSKNKAYAPLLKEDKEKMEDLRKDIREEIKKHMKVLSLAFPTDAERQRFVDAICNYSFLVSKKYRRGFDTKNTRKYLSDIMNFVSREGSSIKNPGVTSEDSMKAVLEQILNLLEDDKGLDVPRLLKDALSKAKDKLSKKDTESDSDSGEAESKVTSSHTEDVISSEDVEDAIDTAKEETGKEKPTTKDIVDEIKEEVEKLFVQDNIDAYVLRINRKVKEFNDGDEAKRKEMMKDYSYSLDSNSKLKVSTNDDVKNMIPAFIDVVGAIVPYYQRKEEQVGVASKTAVQFMFEIYAMKKDHTAKLSSPEKDKLIQTIKEKYPTEYK
jgi:hypothetical protein